MARLALLDLTTPYQSFQSSLIPLTKTLTLTLHNLSRIDSLFSAFYSSLQEGADHANSGLDSVLQLHAATYESCLEENLAYLPSTTRDILRIAFIRSLDARLVQRSYSTLGQILRTLATPLARSEQLEAVWNESGPYLGHPRKVYVRRCVAEVWAGVVRKLRKDGLQKLLGVMRGSEAELVLLKAFTGSKGNLHSRALETWDSILENLGSGRGAMETQKLAVGLAKLCSSVELRPLVEAVLHRIDVAARNQALQTALLSTLGAFLFTTREKTRHGSLVVKSCMLKMLDITSSLASESSDDDRDHRRAVVMSVVGCLYAGDLANWLSPGVQLIEALWSLLVSVK